MVDTAQIFRSAIQRFSARPFLINAQSESVITFQELEERTGRIGLQFQELGIGSQDRVAVLLQNSPEFACVYFACLFLGVTVVPINPSLHEKEIRFILAHSMAGAVIFSPATRPLLPFDVVELQNIQSICLVPESEQHIENGKGDTHSFQLDMNPGSFQGAAAQFPGEEALASVHFTSGTTGQPKAVAHRLQSLITSALRFNDALGFGPEHRLLHVLPMSYMAGFLNTLLCPFLAGASVVISRSFDARTALRFWEVPMRTSVNAMWLVPAVLAALMRMDRSSDGKKYSKDAVHTVCVGTAPLPLKLKLEFEEKYCTRLYESYGLSETLFVATNSGTVHYRPGSVGKPLEGVELKVVGTDGREVSRGTEGEIMIRSPFMMAGYLDYETLLPTIGEGLSWFPSGDIGFVTRDDYLFITGRKKDLIIKGGINISPRVIEEVLLQHEGVEQAAVIGVPHDLYGEDLLAVVKLKPGYLLGSVQPELLGLCKRSLSATSIPMNFRVLDEFPTGATGKVQKDRIRSLVN